MDQGRHIAFMRVVALIGLLIAFSEAMREWRLAGSGGDDGGRGGGALLYQQQERGAARRTSERSRTLFKDLKARTSPQSIRQPRRRSRSRARTIAGYRERADFRRTLPGARVRAEGDRPIVGQSERRRRPRTANGCFRNASRIQRRGRQGHRPLHRGVSTSSATWRTDKATRCRSSPRRAKPAPPTWSRPLTRPPSNSGDDAAHQVRSQSSRAVSGRRWRIDAGRQRRWKGGRKPGENGR